MGQLLPATMKVSMELRYLLGHQRRKSILVKSQYVLDSRKKKMSLGTVKGSCQDKDRSKAKDDFLKWRHKIRKTAEWPDNLSYIPW